MIKPMINQKMMAEIKIIEICILSIGIESKLEIIEAGSKGIKTNTTQIIDLQLNITKRYEISNNKTKTTPNFSDWEVRHCRAASFL